MGRWELEEVTTNNMFRDPSQSLLPNNSSCVQSLVDTRNHGYSYRACIDSRMLSTTVSVSCSRRVNAWYRACVCRGFAVCLDLVASKTGFPGMGRWELEEVTTNNMFRDPSQSLLPNNSSCVQSLVDTRNHGYSYHLQ